jgi:hypothetical protein
VGLILTSFLLLFLVFTPPSKKLNPLEADPSFERLVFFDSFEKEGQHFPFFLVAFKNKIESSESKGKETPDNTFLFLEGDGLAFDGSGAPSSNPTPTNDFVMNLALKTFNYFKNSKRPPQIFYLGRPCQYLTEAEAQKSCQNSHIWTFWRYDKTVITLIQKFFQEQVNIKEASTKLHLISYSGGSYLALAILKSFSNVSFTTIGGNIDPRKLHEIHQLTPFKNEDFWEEGEQKLKNQNLKVNHYVGEEDDLILPYWMDLPIQERKDLIIVKNLDHYSYEKWEEYFLKNILPQLE